MLLRASTQSLTDQLANRFAQRIRDRLLAPGARLPSVRLCAQQQGVSPSTVVAAYDQLLAQGLVEARPHRGFFVRKAAVESDGIAPVATKKIANSELAQPAPVNATALIRGMFHSSSGKPQPGMGVFPPDWLQTDFMSTAVRKVTSTQALREAFFAFGMP